MTMQEEKSFISQALSSALMIRPVFLCVSFPLIACSAVLAQDETSLNRGAYGSVMTPEQVMRELGPGTGLLPGDQAYEGRPVKSVSVRYRSTGKTVSEDRLKNLLATQPGTSYSPEVVNKDLERLLESGLVGGNTTVAVEPSGDGVAVVEWPSQCPEAIPETHLAIRLTPVDETTRDVTITPMGGLREISLEEEQ